MSKHLESLVLADLQTAARAHEEMAQDPLIGEGVLRWAGVCAQSLMSGGTVFFAGNGGSFADAQHLAAEFTGRMLRERGPLAGVCLGTNSSSMSAIANDYAYDQVFSRELSGLGKPMDTLIVLSTSGTSRNILEVAAVAKQMGIPCLGLTGRGDSELATLCEVVRVPAERTDRIQELHMVLGHILCSTTDEMVRRAKTLYSSQPTPD